MPLTDADIRRTYGERIAAARVAAGIATKSDLAARLTSYGAPTSQQAVSFWESGATAPRPSIRHALAHVLGVDVDWLFRHPDEAAA